MSDNQRDPVDRCPACIESARERGALRGIWLLVALARHPEGSLSERERAEVEQARRFLHGAFDLEHSL